jgi:hypothetical protein
MFANIKRSLSLLILLLVVVAAPVACVNVSHGVQPGPTPDQEVKRTEVNVGGPHGITVEHDKPVTPAPPPP